MRAVFRLIHRNTILIVLTIVAIGILPSVWAGRFMSGIIWPEPPVITPGDGAAPPSDAIVLFDGKNFDAWTGAEKWRVDEDGGFTVKGWMESNPGIGDRH